MLLEDRSPVSPGKGVKAHLACAAGRKSQPPDCETNSCPDLPREETGSERVDGLPQTPHGGLPYLLSTSCLQRRAHSVSCCAYAFNVPAHGGSS